MDNEYGTMFKRLMNERNELRKYIVDICELLGIDTGQSILGANCLEFYAVLSSTAKNKIGDLQQQLRMIEMFKEYNNMKLCYKENLKLCKWQEQQINRLATAIEKIAKIVEDTYEALDSQALQEIRQIIKEQTNE